MQDRTRTTPSTGRQAELRLRVVYRSTGRENRKARPPYYSKLLCLASFLRSAQLSGVEPEIVFLNDGPIPEERQQLMRAAGEVVALPSPDEAPIRKIIMTGRGGSGLPHSYLAAVAMADDRHWPDTDVVYLAEDDYVYRPEAFGALAAAARAIPSASYFSLYATFDVARCDTFFVGQEPWMSAVTATSTFGARIGALRADRWIHRIAWFASQRIDQSICQAYQGGRPFAWSRIIGDMVGAGPGPETTSDRLRRGVLQAALNVLATRARFHPHVLVTPYTPLATHMELPFLGVGTDWEAVALETEAWSRSKATGLGDLAPGPPP